jgi:diguanylate cyclase (GGDEF)-like protein
MSNPQTLMRGWAYAFFSVLVLWGLNNVMIGYSAQVLNSNYLVYTCSAFVSCALFLLLVGGKGPLVKETLRSIDTWVFGLIMLIGYMITLSLFSYVTSTEGSLLQRISLLFSVIVSFIFLSRAPTKSQLIGILMVLVGIVIVCRDLPEENRGMIYLLMFLEGMALTARMFLAEIHRPHAHAISMVKDPRAKARVVGFVMFVISTFFLILTGLLALLQTVAPLPIENAIIPTLDSFKHTPSIVAGMIAGVALVAPLRLIEFSSANIIKTENFLAIAALSSAATFFWEWLLSPLTGMSVKAVSTNDILAGVIITVGCMVAALGQMKKQSAKKKWEDDLRYAPQNIPAVEDSREIIANSLEHYSGDIKKVASALDINPSTVNALLDDKDKVLAFKTDVLKNVARLYRRHVSSADALTGLTNRAGFMTALKETSDPYALFYIDLDKFKPVNDTYGHDAGDAVLIDVAEKMKRILPSSALIARLGGDEFCAVIFNINKAKADDYIKKLKTTLSEPLNYNKNEIIIGASIGIAFAPNDGTDPEVLLKIADQGMYDEKKSR